MRILVVGGGGREHALCWKLAQGKDVEKIYCGPGNAGIANVAENVAIQVDDLDALAEFAESNGVDLTVVGPEVPLCSGIADLFMSRGLRVFGPTQAAAMLEGSKKFSKEFMRRNNIPTAEAASFADEEAARKYVSAKIAGNPGVVVKADGLAAGKGVVVATSEREALDAVSECFSGAFGDAGANVLVEELLIGEEASILALTDGNTIIPLASSQDHKRALDGDLGPNTGGMGAYSPAPVVTDELMSEINEKVLNPFLQGVNNEGMDYRGIIYAGIMVTNAGPKVLEFNVRFGDPETQAVLARLDGDLADIMLKTSEKRLSEVTLEWSAEPAVCVVMAAGGYPGAYEKGKVISGIDDAERTGAVVFHAGTKNDGGKIVTSGGRVLGITTKGRDIREAAANAYAAVEKISWDGAQYRGDIAHRAIGI
ncbi:MAG: phosphoribosylamine--glycine ligase [Kiritimatiellaeota bacterium]|nr:phosphoribosylamine--glycine ligase [Kiritimatiellota bacterium]